MKHIIDISTWERRQNYEFFQGFLSSWMCITTEVDCTSAFAEAKQNHTSFFIRYLWAILRASNEVKEMRFRKDKDGRVCMYDTIDVITPINVPGRTFYTVRVPYVADYQAFYRQTSEIISNIPADGDPYGTDKSVFEQGDHDVITVSAVPDLFFTSIVPTLQKPGLPQCWPLLNIGKAVVRGDRRVMPIFITVSHEFVDGEHLAQFFNKIEEVLK